jgi:hypothetical protein
MIIISECYTFSRGKIVDKLGKLVPTCGIKSNRSAKVIGAHLKEDKWHPEYTPYVVSQSGKVQITACYIPKSLVGKGKWLYPF